MNDLSTQQIQAYWNKLLQQGLSSLILKRKLASVALYLKWLKEQGKIPDSSYQLFESEKEKYELQIAKLEWEKKSTIEKVREVLLDKKTEVENKINRASKSQKSSPTGDSRFSQFGVRHYLAGALLLLFIALLGAGAYNQFFNKTSTPFAFPSSLTRGNRTLSFQGRLLDVVGNPIITQSDIVFKLYNVPTGGSALYTFSCTGGNGVTPDEDGIFSTLIGDDCNQTQFIPDNVFTDYPNVYLGVTVGADSEMTPRQHIANVGYAMNAETLQGFPPGTSKYNIPYINSQGDLLIATSAAGLRSTWETADLTLSSAKDLLLNSGDPDLSGGDIIAQASSSASVIRFKTGTTDRIFVDSTTNGGNVGIGTTTPSTFKLEVGGSVGPSANDTYDLGSATRIWNDAYVDRVCFDGGSDCMTSGSPWTDAGTYLYPTNGEVLGNSASAGSNKLAGIYLADSSPLYFGTDNDINASFNNGTSTLNFTQGSNDINFDANTLFIDGSADRVGIGVTNPQTNLEVVGNANTFIMRAPTASSYGSFRIYNDQNNASRALELGYTGSSYAGFGGLTGEFVYLSATGSYPIGLGDNTNLLLIVDNSNDKVGIGTTGPDRKLDILDASSPQLRLTYTDGSVYTDLQTNSSGYLYVNTSGGRTGIGTSSPLETLDVNGNATVSGNLTLYAGARSIQTTAFNGLTIGGASTGNITLDPKNAAAGGFVAPATTNVTDLGQSGLQFRNLYAQVLYQNGNLVCDATGANCPAGSSLWTDGGAYLYPTSGEVLGNNTSGGSNKIAGIYLADSSPLYFGTDNDINASFNNSTSTLNFTQGSNDINFDANTLFIDGSANRVGIGTTTPGTNLDVASQIRITNDTTVADSGTSGAYGALRLRYNNWTGGHGANIQFDIGQYDSAGNVIRSELISGGGSGVSDLIFYGKNSVSVAQGAVTEYMRIKYGGAVGVGISSPIGELHVSRDQANGALGKALGIFDQTENQDIITASASAVKKFAVTNGGNIQSAVGAKWLPFSDSTTALNIANSSGTSFVTYDSSNSRVGIGTTTPNNLLHVYMNASGANYIKVENATAASAADSVGLQLTSGAETSYITYAGQNDNLRFWVDGGSTPAMTLLADGSNNGTGSLGIGTVSPGKKLEVVDNTTAQLRLAYTNGSVYTDFQTDSSGNLTIDATGTKSIVADDLQVTGNDILDSSAATRLTLGATTTLTNTALNLTGTATLTNSVAMAWDLANSSTTALNIEGGLMNFDTSNSRVGIGLTNPSYKLDVKSGSVSDILRLDGSGGVTNLVFSDSGTDKWKLIQQASNRFSFNYQTAENVSFLSGGNVGIGTTSPIEKLDVAGNATVSGNLTLAGSGRTIATRALTTLTLGDSQTGDIYLQPKGSVGAVVQIGSGGAGSTTPDVFGLDVKSDSGDPTIGFNGAIYYNANSNKFRCYENGAWTNCVGSGTLTGSGATGQATFWTGTSTLSGGNQFSWDNTNKKFALGFSSVNQGLGEFHVTRTLADGALGKALAIFDQTEDQDILTASASGITKLTVTNSGSLVFNQASTISANSGALTLQPASGSNLNVSLAGTGDLAVNTNQLYVDTSASSVGIGTTTPRRTLDVLNTSNPQMRLTYTDNSVYTDFQTDSSGNLTIDGTGTKSIIADDLQVTGNNILDSSATSRITLGATTTLTNTALNLTGTATLTSNTALAWDIANSSTTALNIESGLLNLDTSNSRLGIGTTSPLEKLDVSGNATVSGNLALYGGARSIQTTAANHLTIGGSSTGNITLNPKNAATGGFVAPNTTNVTDLGASASLQWRNIYGQALYQNGNAVCDSSGSNCTGVRWDQIANPTGNQSLTMAAYTSTWGWTSTGALDAHTVNFNNNSSSSTTQNALIMNNALVGSFTDTNTESLILLQQLDTTAAGTTVLENALKIDAAANSGITNGIQVTNSAGNVATGLLIADTGGGTVTTGISLTGTFTDLISATNFAVNNAGNITVAAGQGLDTNASGILALGNTTATTVNIGNTAATTLALGAGGSLTRTINIGTGTGVDTIHIGDGGTGADVITIGSTNAGAVSIQSNAALTLTGSTNSIIDFPNFDVATTGNITVVSGQGLDTPGSGTLALGNVNATTVNVGNTAATTIAIGAGGSATRTFNIGTGTGADTINIGTGASTSDDINLGGLSTSTIDVLGTIRAGDGGSTNYLQITSGGNLSFVGSASTIDKVSGTLNINTTNNQAITTGNGTFTTGGALQVNGNTTLGDAITDTLTFTARVAQDADLIPITTTGTNDLGSASLPWDNVYAVAFTQNGNSVCDSSGSGCPASTTRWNTVLDPNGNQSLTMAAYTSTWGWTSSAGLDGLTANFNNNSGSSTTQNMFVLNNAAVGSFTDTNTESLILLQQLDTTAAGTTVLENALKIDAAANSGITNGIQVTNSAGNVATGLLIADTVGGTLTTGISMTGTFTNYIDTPNFDVANSGNITVAASQGIDTNASGALKLGATTATSVDIGRASQTINFTSPTWVAASASTLDLANSSTTALNIESGLLNLDTQNSRVGIGTTAPGAKLDVESIQTSGTVTKIGAPSSVSLAGTLTGLNLDLSTNYTATGFSLNGQTIALPAVTNTGGGSYSYKGQTITGGALVQNTGAGTNTWIGTEITMPNITQTTGSVTSTGLKIIGGTVTSGTAYGFVTDANAGNVGIGTTTPTSNFQVARKTSDFNSNNDATLQTWSTSGQTLPANRANASAASANGYIYVTGGETQILTAAAQVATVYYTRLNNDGETGGWMSTTALPANRASHASIAVNGYLYVIGGRSADTVATGTNTVYYAKINSDGTVGAWNTTSTIPTSLSQLDITTANGYMYLAGGYNTSSVAQTAVYYAKINSDGTLGTWVTNANSLGTARRMHKVTVANGRLYAIGGVSQNDTEKALINSDGSIGTWSTNGNTMPAARANHVSAVADGNLYVISGGTNGSDAGNTTVYYATLNSDGTTGSWSTDTASPIPAARATASSVNANGYIYVIGGATTAATSTAGTDTVYFSSTARVRLAGALDLIGLTNPYLASASGQTASTLYAGNIFSNNNLSVGGYADLWNGLSVTGGLSSYLTSPLTTASTQIANQLTFADTGIVTTGTDTSYGNYISMTRTGATGGTINTYGEYINLVTDNAGSGTHTGYGLFVNIDGNTDNDYAGVFMGGNVGIGTSTPTQRLDVAGPVRLGANGNANDVLNTTSGSAPSGDLFWGSRTLCDSTNNCLSGLQTRWNNLQNPTGNLSLTMSTNTTTFNWATGTSTNNLFSLTTDASANGTGALLNIQTGSSATVLPLRVRAGSVEGITVDAAGEVGIGTTAPTNKLEVAGDIRAALLCDTSDANCITGGTPTYFVDVGNSGTSLKIFGDQTFVGGGLIDTGGNNTLTLDTGTASLNVEGGSNGGNVTMCVSFDGSSSCDGKIDVGTVDPPYTINGKKYATYMASMTGVKEETTGQIQTTEYIPGLGYRAVINFSKQPDGSDLWLFSKATNLKTNIDKMVTLLTAQQNTRTWYKVDRNTYSLYIYSNKPTTVAYRLTAPRFDYEKWANVTPNGSTGFVVNDPDGPQTVALNEYGNVPPAPEVTVNGEYVYDGTLEGSENYVNSLGYQLTNGAQEMVEEISIASKGVFATITSGLITTQNAVVKNILTAQTIVTKRIQITEKITSPIVQTTHLNVEETATITKVETNEIQPKNQDLTINLAPSPTSNQQPATTGALAKLIIKGLEGKTVAVVDNAGNASFSGTLAAKDASISGTIAAEQGRFNEASISGNLIAKQVDAENIRQLEASTNELTTNNQQLATNINDIQQLLANLQSQPLPDPEYYQNLPPQPTTNNQQLTTALEQLTVTGNSNLYNLSVSGTALVGQILVDNNSIVSLASDLRLSALNQITLFDGKVTIAKDGTITTSGSLIAQGGIKTNTLQPVNEAEDINVILKPQGTGTLGSNTKLNIKDTLGNEVASIDASGSARLNEVTAASAYFKNGIAVDKYLEASESGSLITANENLQINGIASPAFETGAKTAGTAILPQNETEVIIYNQNIRENSLIYLTPETQSSAGQLVVAEKNIHGKTYFKVSVDSSLHPNISFNWLIIN